MPRLWQRHCWMNSRRRRTGHHPCQMRPMTKSQFRILRSLVYGIDTFRGLFNDRQLYVLGSLCEAVRAAHDQMLAEGMER